MKRDNTNFSMIKEKSEKLDTTVTIILLLTEEEEVVEDPEDNKELQLKRKKKKLQLNNHKLNNDLNILYRLIFFE